MTIKSVKEFLKMKIPNIKISNIMKTSGGEDLFYIDAEIIYKNFSFDITFTKFKNRNKPIISTFLVDRGSEKVQHELNVILGTISREEAERITKKLRDTSTKLPNKKLKLEGLEYISKELKR